MEAIQMVHKETKSLEEEPDNTNQVTPNKILDSQKDRTNESQTNRMNISSGVEKERAWRMYIPSRLKRNEL